MMCSYINIIYRQILEGVGRKMDERISIFGESLEINEASLNGIKLHVYMLEVGTQLRMMMKNAFNKMDTVYTFERIGKSVVNNVYTALYKHGLEYLKSLGITEYNVEDIELFQGYLETQYDNLTLLIVQNKIQNEQALRKRNISGDKKERERLKLEKVFYQKLQGEFMDACFMDAMEMVKSLAIFIQREDIPIKIITDNDEEKGTYLFEQLKKTSKSGSQGYKIAFQMFKTNPTELEYYDYCMLQFPEQLDNIVMLQTLVGLEVNKTILEKALKKMYDKMPHDTEVRTLAIKNKIENIQSKIDISNNTYVKKIDKLLYDFDIQARTFCNILFDTRELKESAEKDFCRIESICGKIDLISEEECEQKKKLISEENVLIEIKKLFLEKLDNRITQIWKEEDADKLQDIYKKTNIYDSDSILESVNNINRIGRTSDKERYINALNGINDNTLKLVRQYIKWENTKGIKKHWLLILLILVGCLVPFGIGILFLPMVLFLWIIQFIKKNRMKNAWNLLTINGAVIHPQILSTGVDCNKEEKIIETEKAEIEEKRIEQEKLKKDIENRTVRGITYKSLEEAEQAKADNRELEALKLKLLEIKSQKKRQEILKESALELTTMDAQNRYNLLKTKVNMEVPILEKTNKIYGVSILVTLFITIVLVMTLDGEANFIGKFCIMWTGFGLFIWPVWKIIQIINSKRVGHYKNLKKI